MMKKINALGKKKNYKKCPNCKELSLVFYPPVTGDTHYITPPRERCSVKTKEGYKQNPKCDFQVDLI